MSQITKTNATLLLKLRDLSDIAQWQRFWDCYHPFVYRYCRRRGLQHADAEDVVQDALLSIARSIGQFAYNPLRGSFRSWLLTVTRSKLNNYFHQRVRQASVVHPSLEAEAYVQQDRLEHAEEARRRAERFDKAMAIVSREFAPSTFKAFYLVAVRHVPAREVSRQVGISVQAVYIAKSRVLRRIRQCISDPTNTPDTKSHGRH